MKVRIGLFAIAMLAATSALAQTPSSPERIVPKHTISLAVGQSQSFRFPTAFDTISVATHGTVEASAATDHTMALQGVGEGETTLTVFGAGQELYSATVVVTPEPGHVVRIFGTSTKQKPVPDYVGFYCTDRFCGRADKELNGLREVSSSTTTVGGLSRTITFGK